MIEEIRNQRSNHLVIIMVVWVYEQNSDIVHEFFCFFVFLDKEVETTMMNRKGFTVTRGEFQGEVVRKRGHRRFHSTNTLLLPLTLPSMCSPQ